MASLAEFLFDRAKVRHVNLRVAVLIAFQVGAAFFQAMTGQAAAVIHDAEMRFMDEMREA